jgi:hypothetical protein
MKKVFASALIFSVLLIILNAHPAKAGGECDSSNFMGTSFMC